MWKKYEVELNFVGKLCGSVPMNPEMIQGWLDARKPRVRPPGSKDILETAEEVITSIQDQKELNAETEKRVTLGFQKVDGGLVMRGGTIKAHLKDCARILSQNYIGKIQGEKSLNVRVTNCVQVEEYWIPLLRNGKPIDEADNYIDKAVHVMTRIGPVNALKRIQFIEKPSMIFNLLVMESSAKRLVVSLNDLKSVFQYGGIHGYAGERGDGEGRYTFTIKEITDDAKTTRKTEVAPVGK